ncbi:hypothetical protein KHS38_18805 [Mucilaginibacter sp. Bleaf8]|uniref:acyltransferase n=1 Tax=Mucilaginibacter sp. Bleaf8 TaxID=2834430 RepID=UPI001BCE03EF|nr:hypothetical protein [Mucilaginibacter sp. Bleaf8]MBS7566462.1 hypothetical protein [Mucilaginibacter sp. Bleaf8]
MLLKLLTMILPWPLRRRALQSWFGFEIHSTAKIGLSWVFPANLVMGPNTKIDHFVVAVHLNRIVMHDHAIIGRSNWITGFETNSTSMHFKHQTDRQAVLIMKEHSAITKKHHIDCTSAIEIGKFTTVAGYNSQLLTHSIDVFENRQHSAPITIGDYCFIGTNVTVLGGAVLPSFCVLGAKSLLNKPFESEWTLYGGVPAKELKKISRDAKYFHRLDGFVY